MNLDDARAVAAAYRENRRGDSPDIAGPDIAALDIAALEAAVMVYLERYPGVSESDARSFVSDLIVQAGEAS